MPDEPIPMPSVPSLMAEWVTAVQERAQREREAMRLTGRAGVRAASGVASSSSAQPPKTGADGRRLDLEMDSRLSEELAQSGRDVRAGKPQG